MFSLDLHLAIMNMQIEKNLILMLPASSYA